MGQLEATVEKRISPLRCASVEMTSFFGFAKNLSRVWKRLAGGGVEGLISRVDSLLGILLRA